MRFSKRAKSTNNSSQNNVPYIFRKDKQSFFGNSNKDKEQEKHHQYFESKKEAYNYAQEKSILLNMGDGYVLERETSGYILENGHYIVLDPSKNTRTKSYNEIVIKENKNFVRFEGELYKIKSQFHVHPSGMKYTPGRIGVSRADLNLMFNRLGGTPISILYKGNEWVLSPGNQYQKYGYSYSLTNKGSW